MTDTQDYAVIQTQAPDTATQAHAPDIAIQIHTQDQPKSKSRILTNIRNNLPALIAGAITGGCATTLFIATTEGEWLPIEISSVGANLVINTLFGSRVFNNFFGKNNSSPASLKDSLAVESVHKQRCIMAAKIIFAVALTLPTSALTYTKTFGELYKKILYTVLYFGGRFPVNYSPANQIPTDISNFWKKMQEFPKRNQENFILKAQVLSNLRKAREQLSVLDLNRLAKPRTPSISTALPLLDSHIKTTYPGNSIYSRLYNHLADSSGGRAVMSFFNGASKLFAAATGGIIAYSISGYGCGIADGLIKLLGADEELQSWYLLAANIIYLPAYYLGTKGGFAVAEQFLDRVKMLFKYGAFLTNNDRTPQGTHGKAVGFIFDLLSAGFAGVIASLSGYTARLLFGDCPVQFGSSAIMALASSYNAIWVLLAIFAARAYCLSGGDISYDQILEKEIAKVESLPAEEISKYLQKLDPAAKDILCSEEFEYSPLLSKQSQASISSTVPGQSPFISASPDALLHPGQSPYTAYQSV
ncbi:MAG: hypothetical protein K0S08_1097 [Gammaproteobacteria bacterium]|jgi:hypothetical protein|nr:hypothetical protein [Gammaproteobacteria bacterium]